MNASHERDIARWIKAAAGGGSRCFLRSAHHARPQPGNSSCLRARHRAGDAVARCHGRKESGHSEGLPDFLREFESGGSGSCGPSLTREKVAAGVKFYLGAASAWVQREAERRGIWQTLLDAGATPLPAGCGPCIGLGVGLLEKGEVGISATNRNFKGRMGSRDAQCYLASPEVVAASAIAGYITGAHPFADVTPARRFTEINGNGKGPSRK